MLKVEVVDSMPRMIKKYKSMHYHIPLFNKMSFTIAQSFICIYLSKLLDTQLGWGPCKHHSWQGHRETNLLR